MKQKILVLCTGNSCRSQMAEGYLRHLAGDRFEVVSAGLEPSVVNPKAIRVMLEDGVDISSHTSKDVAQFIGQHFILLSRFVIMPRNAVPFSLGRRSGFIGVFKILPRQKGRRKKL